MRAPATISFSLKLANCWSPPEGGEPTRAQGHAKIPSFQLHLAPLLIFHPQASRHIQVPNSVGK